MVDDPILQSLLALQASLLREANAAGEGPANKRKSDFKTEKDRTCFIDAWGMAAYHDLPD